MIKIISFKICPFVQRVTALLEAKQLPYEIEYISLKNKPQWFLEQIFICQTKPSLVVVKAVHQQQIPHVVRVVVARSAFNL